MTIRCSILYTVDLCGNKMESWSVFGDADDT